MTNSKKVKPPKLNSGHVESALRNHINFRVHKLIPEAAVPFTSNRWDKYRADYISVSSSGYATEYEVKVSMADWKNDLKKPKWDNMPAWITRIIYVVPEHLGVPEWVPPQAGIWHVYVDVRTKKLKVKVIKTPKRIGTEKVPTEMVNKWISNLYFRFWNMRVERDKTLPKL